MNNSSTYSGIVVVDVSSVVVPVVRSCIRCKLNVGCMMKANLQTVLLVMTSIKQFSLWKTKLPSAHCIMVSVT